MIKIWIYYFRPSHTPLTTSFMFANRNNRAVHAMSIAECRTERMHYVISRQCPFGFTGTQNPSGKISNSFYHPFFAERNNEHERNAHWARKAALLRLTTSTPMRDIRCMWQETTSRAKTIKQRTECTTSTYWQYQRKGDRKLYRSRCEGDKATYRMHY